MFWWSVFQNHLVWFYGKFYYNKIVLDALMGKQNICAIVTWVEKNVQEKNQILGALKAVDAPLPIKMKKVKDNTK